MPQRVAAVLPALNRAREVVLARVEQDRERAAALLDLEVPQVAEPDLGEVVRRPAKQIVGRAVALLFSLGIS